MLCLQKTNVLKAKRIKMWLWRKQADVRCDGRSCGLVGSLSPGSYLLLLCHTLGRQGWQQSPQSAPSLEDAFVHVPCVSTWASPRVPVSVPPRMPRVCVPRGPPRVPCVFVHVGLPVCPYLAAPV